MSRSETDAGVQDMRFPGGGRAMGAMMRAHDWSTSPLGEPSGWPQSLRTVVGLMLENRQLMFVAWGPELAMLYNDGYVPALGRKHPRALGRPFREVWPDILDAITPHVETALGGDATWDENLRIVMERNGFPEDAWFTFSYSPVRDETGAVAGFFCAGVETTGQVLAERNAAAERERQRLSLQQMPGFVGLLAGAEHRFEYVNDAYVAIAGNRDFIGRTVREVFPELDGQGFYELLDAAYRTGEPFVARALPMRLLSTGDHFIDLLYQPIRDDSGVVKGIFVGGYDVTDQVRATTHLEATIAERTAELVTASEALRQSQKMEAVGQLTGGLAHDFNNLLTGMMGNLELLQLRVSQGRFEDVERFILAAQGAGRRAASLTQRLLAFSRRQTLDPKPTDINRLVSGMEELLRRTMGPSNTVEVIGAVGLWTAMIDADQLENALLNLCINARDAMPDGGKLTIETANKWMDDRTARERDLPAGQYLSVCVTDTGSGMSSETIARAFDPFFTTKPIGKGTGLGLSMVYGFARQSGGQVRIYSEEGQGTTLCIYLPRHHGEAPNETTPADAAQPARATGATILVIDDEATIRHLLDEVLGALGYTVIGAADGAAGLTVLESGAGIDLLVTDVGLPNGMNGRQVADAARALRPGLKVLFITGYAENAAVGNGYLEPGMALLTKPFSMDDLTRKVAAILHREDAPGSR